MIVQINSSLHVSQLSMQFSPSEGPGNPSSALLLQAFTALQRQIPVGNEGKYLLLLKHLKYHSDDLSPPRSQKLAICAQYSGEL